MRTTDLSVQEIAAELKNPDSAFRPCQLLNELGNILVEQGEGEEEAEVLLAEALDSDDQNRQLPAACWLTEGAKYIRVETRDKLLWFILDAGEDFTAKVKESLESRGIGPDQLSENRIQD